MSQVFFVRIWWSDQGWGKAKLRDLRYRVRLGRSRVDVCLLNLSAVCLAGKKKKVNSMFTQVVVQGKAIENYSAVMLSLVAGQLFFSRSGWGYTV